MRAFDVPSYSSRSRRTEQVLRSEKPVPEPTQHSTAKASSGSHCPLSRFQILVLGISGRFQTIRPGGQAFEKCRAVWERSNAKVPNALDTDWL